MSSRVKCFLKCLNITHEPIILDHLIPLVLGRSPCTKIKDKRCSKSQVELTANCNEFKVNYKHLGANQGSLKGNPTKIGETYQLYHGDVFEFLFSKFPHRIEFDPAPSCITTSQDPKLETAETKKDSKDYSPMPKQKQNSKRRANADTENDTKKLCLDPKVKQWESIDGDSLLIYNRNCLASDKIAGYDIDGTLITTVSGRVFAKDINDWKILFPQVPGKLKQLIKEGYKIVLFTNQAGVAIGKVSVNGIQTKIERIMEKLGISGQALVSTGKGKYRKPSTGMWDYFVEKCNGGVTPELKSSLYVGDAAGRPEVPKQRKKDHSVGDRLFALNIGMPFYTPEEHFLDHKPTSFKMPEFIPSEIDCSKPLYNPASTKAPLNTPEVIILVGFPGSGKSTFVEKNLLKLGYIQANRDTIGSWQKCVSLMEKSLKDGKNVVIDNTNPDKASRARYVEAAKKLKASVRCFVMDITLNQARHNNKFREFTGSEHSKVNDMIYNMYKSKLEEPNVAEGFEDVVRVNFVPSFKNHEMEKLYKTFLLEK